MKYLSGLAAFTLALAGAWLAALAAGAPGAGRLASPVVAAPLAAILFLLAGALALNPWLGARDRRAAFEHLEALCALDPSRPDSPRPAALPPVPKSGPWPQLAERLATILGARWDEFQQLRHHRATLEVRWRRATQEVARCRAALAALAQPVVVVDGAGDVILANPAAQRLFRLPAGEANQPPPRRLPCQRVAELLRETASAPRPGTRSEELTIPDAAGQPQCYRVSVAALGAADGDPASTPQGAVAVLHGIGREKALQKRNAEFVSAVSHEMKTPLAGIKAYVELLADGDAEDDQTREEFLAVINSQADRLQRLIENMLNLARIEAGVVQVNKQPRSLNELLGEAVRVVQPAAQAKEVQLAAELSPLYLGVLADRDLLLQAAINLLSNAVKYTPAGGRVTLRSRLMDDQVAFEVEDTGVGLSPEDCQRVFERFYRVKKNKQMAPGTGLGLPLAKHIVQDVHGGKLTVRSVEGQGSTFTVSLPTARANRAVSSSDRPLAAAKA